MDSEKVDNSVILPSATGLGDLLLQHSEIGDWCDVVDKQIDEVGYEVTESKKTSVASNTIQRAEQPLFFSPPFYAYVSNVNYHALRHDIFYFFGGHEKVLGVHMYMNANSFNGNCLIELSNFTAFIDALKLDEHEILGRSIGVEHFIYDKRRKYSMQQLENAREDIRRRDDGCRHSYNQNHRSFNDSGPRDGGRRQVLLARPPNYGNTRQQSHNTDGPIRTGGSVTSNDVRATQMHQPHSSQMNLATNFQRGPRGSQHYQKSQPRYPPPSQQQSILPSRNARVEERQPLIDAIPPRSVVQRPAHSDIYGLGKPADTSNKLLEIQEKLDKERMTAVATHPSHDNNDTEDAAAATPPQSHSYGGGGRHYERPTHSSETGHSKHSRPSVSQSGLDAIKKIVVASNSTGSNRGNIEKSGTTATDSASTNDTSSVNGNRVRKSFSRDSQKSGGGSGGGRRSGPSRGPGGAKIYVNSSSRKSLSHQSSIGCIENLPAERKSSNHQNSASKFEKLDYSNGEEHNSQQSRTSQYKNSRSEMAGERHIDSQSRKASFGSTRLPRPTKSDEFKSNSSLRNSRKRSNHKTPIDSVPFTGLVKVDSAADADNDNSNTGNNVGVPVKLAHVQKPVRASSAGEPATEKTTRQSSVEIMRPTSEAVTEAKSDAVSSAASAKAKNKKKKRQDSVQAYSKTNRFAALPVGDSH